ncbi:MAG: RNA methyltransferase [Lachnospiraceae bacterium]|nr:RNA methyltransferase [Lachnospiraceae bacterium]
MNTRICPIESINDERVAVYIQYNEPQLLHYNEPKSGVFVAETPMVIERALRHGIRPLSLFVETGALQRDELQPIIELSGDVPIYTAELDEINKTTGFNLTRGVLAAFERPVQPAYTEILANSECIAVLEEVVNPTNLGAIFRSAAALGVDAVLMTHGSTNPLYRRATRVSMGTVLQLPWAYLPTGSNVPATLHDAGYTVISMALREDAKSLGDPAIPKTGKRAIVFGNEADGISEETLAGSDHVVIIPMESGVDSLNVAASSAVAFWELCRK